MSLILNSLNDPKLTQLLLEGSVGVLPTDTVYGLVCRAADEKAVGRLYRLKKREQKPGTVIAANVEQLVELGLKARYLKAVESYWPGSVSVIIPTHELAYIHLGKGGIAVRIPDNGDLLKLLEQAGPLLTSSANKSNQKTAETIQAASNYFAGDADFYVNGGNLEGRQPSTLIRIVDDEIEVLRQGTVKINSNGAIEPAN